MEVYCLSFTNVLPTSWSQLMTHLPLNIISRAMFTKRDGSLILSKKDNFWIKRITFLWIINMIIVKKLDSENIMSDIQLLRLSKFFKLLCKINQNLRVRASGWMLREPKFFQGDLQILLEISGKLWSVKG